MSQYTINLQYPRLFAAPALPPPVRTSYRDSTALFPSFSLSQKLGLVLITLAIGAFLNAFWPIISAEVTYNFKALKENITLRFQQKPVEAVAAETEAKPKINPLVRADGSVIEPVNTDFAIIVPKLDINANVVGGVNPGNRIQYLDALKKGVAHASTSYYPDENGTVYLFSHSTNYEWFVKDLNAIFYLLNKLEEDDLIVIMYLDKMYTYQLREKRIVSPKDVTYLIPEMGRKNLILQTCWPPGTVSKRMLILADLVDVQEF